MSFSDILQNKILKSFNKEDKPKNTKSEDLFAISNLSSNNKINSNTDLSINIY